MRSAAGRDARTSRRQASLRTPAARGAHPVRGGWCASVQRKRGGPEASTRATAWPRPPRPVTTLSSRCAFSQLRIRRFHLRCDRRGRSTTKTVQPRSRSDKQRRIQVKTIVTLVTTVMLVAGATTRWLPTCKEAMRRLATSLACRRPGTSAAPIRRRAFRARSATARSTCRPHATSSWTAGKNVRPDRLRSRMAGRTAGHFLRASGQPQSGSPARTEAEACSSRANASIGSFGPLHLGPPYDLAILYIGYGAANEFPYGNCQTRRAFMLRPKPSAVQSHGLGDARNLLEIPSLRRR
jgi:hypothetical protein